MCGDLTYRRCAKLENAQFQNRVHNHAVYKSEVRKVQGFLITENDFELISNRCFTKKGVLKLEMSDNLSTITVYFLDWIDQVTINWLFTETNAELDHTLRIDQKVDYNFKY